MFQAPVQQIQSFSYLPTAGFTSLIPPSKHLDWHCTIARLRRSSNALPHLSIVGTVVRRISHPYLQSSVWTCSGLQATSSMQEAK